jgi:nucleoside-diphosphate-sugar epimerase
MPNDQNKIEGSISVGLVGCGWLGKALALSLLERNISVLATSSKQGNVYKLNQQSIMAQQLVLPEHSKKLQEHSVFAQHNLVISITPQFRKGKTDYADKINQLVYAAQQRGIVQRIILLSSTAIYGGLEGNVDEESTLNTTSEKVKILNAAEQAVLKFSNKGMVIRLAGLVGPERHPGKFLAAKKTLSGSLAPVNLIHQQDAIGLIESLLKTNSTRKIFNGVSDTHVSKQEYYQVAAKALMLSPPSFLLGNTNITTRVVHGDKTQKALQYKFIFPDLLTWL